MGLGVVGHRGMVGLLWGHVQGVPGLWAGGLPGVPSKGPDRRLFDVLRGLRPLRLSGPDRLGQAPDRFYSLY